ncbi:small ribosomal subunit Rsm22 family protein [uncultured Nitratireductor sp.]|uniref:small ribosomal subunit Rsm22 family protein n=1 Tax=uncultured Nitratireductor sp. TaxID=520953 RepID=UPI0026076857|nr:small ribosomal subunit Rsm22 family protein [uncultured Nitratireductor sp.]
MPERHDRIITQLKAASSMVQLKLCTSGSALDKRLVTHREGRIFKADRGADWDQHIGPKTGIDFRKHDACFQWVRASFVRPNGRTAL